MIFLPDSRFLLGQFEVAAGLLKRLLALHHRQASFIAQLHHGLSGDFCHGRLLIV
jgi:hypothetical protein